MRQLSVITATYNSMQYLPVLVESLRNQTDKDFEWVVADGASTDGTLEYLQSINDLNIKIISQEDFGIYDALNRAIKACSGDFYLVLGSDDTLYSDSISILLSKIEYSKNVDFFVFNVNYSKKVISPKNKYSWFYGQFSYISMHSVGLVINKSLHNRYGFYSRKFPIAADQYFIMKSIKNGAVVSCFDNVVGEHGADGVSGTDHLGVITEFYRVQMLVGFNKYVQTFLFFLRIIKNIRFL